MSSKTAIEWLAHDDDLEERNIAETGKRLRKEAEGLDKQEEALKDQAKQLLKEARQLNARSKRLKREASDHDAERLVRLEKRKTFDVLCARLRCDDSSLNEIKHSHDFPIGYARTLGEAMLQNTHVSRLEISLIRSIPNLDTIESVGADAVEMFVLPLVQTIASSKSLRYISVDAPHPDDKVNQILQDSFVGACLQNQNVEGLSLDLIRLPVDAFQRCQSPKKLISLELENWDRLNHDNDPYSPQELRTISELFQYLPSLASLGVCDNDLSFYETVLCAAHKARCPLKDIQLGGSLRGPKVASALTTILHSSKEFNHLCMNVVSFDGRDMTGLTNALKGPDNATSLSTLTELSLCSCWFNKDAMRLLRAFMHTRVEPGRTSSLKKFTIDYKLSSHHDGLPSKDFAAMLSIGRGCGKNAELRAAHEAYPTIGSLIETLALVGVDNEFMPSLAEHAHLFRLTDLKVDLDGYYSFDVDALAKWIATSKWLRTILVQNGRPSDGLRPVLVSLLENDNVQSISIDTFESDVVAKRAQAYCDRNRYLDGLLDESSTVNNDSTGATAIEGGEQPHDDPATTATANGQTFCPTLWQSAMVLPKARSTKVIRSLLGLCDSIGTS